MKNKTFLSISIFILFLYTNAQIGIGTENPTNTLDVNGTFRVRNVPISTTTSDYNIVIDNEGVIKKSITSTKGVLRAYMSSDFSNTGGLTTIYKIINWNILDNPDGSFNGSTGVFTAPVKGLYKIVYTATIQLLVSSSSLSNIVVGVVDASTNKWITRLSISTNNLTQNTRGNSSSFTGLVQLEEGQQCYFGITGGTRIIVNTTESTEGLVGNFFELELIKN